MLKFSENTSNFEMSTLKIANKKYTVHSTHKRCPRFNEASTSTFSPLQLCYLDTSDRSFMTICLVCFPLAS